ncbi:Sad1-interacting factor 3 [Cladophialophora chaetospira]|uniref:Sad1-interacting factor 3 n=1 Tax=Cladophialophora chaetospira TaxID=386627 RepID=A0AA39CQY3_9EURO|nr:Sad1-interacting factor 3 [Cladophialophora chaetospira]
MSLDETNIELEQVSESRENRPFPAPRKQTSRFITVDSVLQHVSDVPSAQRRVPQRPRATRTTSGRPLDPRLTGRYAGPVGPRIPARSTKTSEKLVLLPEAIEEDDEKGEFGPGDGTDKGPPKDDEDFRKPGGERVKSYAERLPKARRTEKELPRVTAYCTAQAYKLQSTATFVRQRHGGRAKLYDDCLYCAYHLPLLPGTEGYRLRSSPPIQSAKGGSVLDEAMERSEQRDYGESYFAEEEQHSVRGHYTPEEATDDRNNDGELEPPRLNGQRRDSNHSQRSLSPGGGQSYDSYRFAEMYVFSYGVVVFWNFSERQEKDVLADFAFATIVDPNTNLVSPLTLTTNALEEEDFETEEFHFEYNNEISRPRVFNDMITLRSGDHMIKLAISHAIAQSTKLSFFEEAMAAQMEAAKDVPGKLAKTGELGMKRGEVIKLLGGLFKSRVEVNLSSNVLDVPNLIWDSEPTLHPLYNAVREYLEIKPRIQVLNERCRVFLDLAEVLSDYISDNKESQINWIIIVLIVISILVTCSEVFLRFGILNTRGPGAKAPQAVQLSLVGNEF